MLKSLALVTGGSRGIGAGIARALGARGFHVLVNYVSQQNQAEVVVKDIVDKKGSAEVCQFDVSSLAAIESAFELISKKNMPLGVLVNNAGITRDSLLVRIKESDLEETLSINLKGLIYCTKAASRLMMRQRFGNIVQISSVVGECGNPGQSVYAASKAAIIGFSKSVAKELAGRNIRVNVVTPGYIDTEMTASLSEAQRTGIIENIPLGFVGKPEDVANLVVFLSSPESRFITGQVIGVNGGQYI